MFSSTSSKLICGLEKENVPRFPIDLNWNSYSRSTGPSLTHLLGWTLTLDLSAFIAHRVPIKDLIVRGSMRV